MGTLYSRKHLVEPRTANDSKRARTRLGSKASEMLHESKKDYLFARAVSAELGVEVPTSGMGYYNINAFFAKCELRDMLDSITLVAHALATNGDERIADKWVSFADRVMREEALVFSVQADASVTHLVDEAFAANGATAVVALAKAKYAAASAALTASLREINALDGNPKNAVRSAFEAAEACFKAATGSNANLGEKELTATLAPKVDAIYQGADAVARRSAGLVVQAMKDWANAAHPYRHGHGVPEPVEPSRTMAITLVALAIAHMRFIAEHFPP